ncbi:MAG: hypothetical protein KC535_03140 [Nanoarchaeota archaeon]|nr:hypothetical protein [Nanoarchaeota archaeon]
MISEKGSYKFKRKVIDERTDRPLLLLSEIGQYDHLLRKADREMLKAVQELYQTEYTHLYLTGSLVEGPLFGTSKRYNDIDVLVQGEPEEVEFNHHDLMRRKDSEVKNILEKKFGSMNLEIEHDGAYVSGPIDGRFIIKKNPTLLTYFFPWTDKSPLDISFSYSRK